MDHHERELRRLLLEDRSRRAEAEAAEAELDAARLGLHQVFDRWARTGAVVVVDLAGQVVQGRIGHLGRAAATLVEDSDTRILFEFDAVDGVRERPGSVMSGPHEWTAGHPGSVVALLRELVGRERVVELVRRSGDRIVGVVTGVSDEVVVVRTHSGVDVIVPQPALVAVCYEG